MANHLEVWMTDPMAYGGFGTREKVVNDRDIVTEDHQSVHEMGADKARTASD